MPAPRKLDDAQRAEITRELKNGAAARELAAQYSVNVATIRVMLPPERRKKRSAAVLQLTGLTFGQWTVQAPSDYRTPGAQKTYWVCRCSCGNIRNVIGTNLVNGQSKRCSQCRSKIATAARVKASAGRRKRKGKTSP